MHRCTDAQKTGKQFASGSIYWMSRGIKTE